jgi:hypothetical protein
VALRHGSVGCRPTVGGDGGDGAAGTARAEAKEAAEDEMV